MVVAEFLGQISTMLSSALRFEEGYLEDYVDAAVCIEFLRPFTAAVTLNVSGELLIVRRVQVKSRIRSGRAVLGDAGQRRRNATLSGSSQDGRGKSRYPFRGRI